MSETHIGFSFLDYSTLAFRTHSGYPEGIPPIVYDAMCISAEANEGIEKIKKRYRDNHGIFNPTDIQALMLEAGDTLWYLNRYAEELRHRMMLFAPREIPLSEEVQEALVRPGRGLEIIAHLNLVKLQDRAARGVVGGSGDER